MSLSYASRNPSSSLNIMRQCCASLKTNQITKFELDLNALRARPDAVDFFLDCLLHLNEPNSDVELFHTILSLRHLLLLRYLTLPADLPTLVRDFLVHLLQTKSDLVPYNIQAIIETSTLLFKRSWLSPPTPPTPTHTYKNVQICPSIPSPSHLFQTLQSSLSNPQIDGIRILNYLNNLLEVVSNQKGQDSLKMTVQWHKDVRLNFESYAEKCYDIAMLGLSLTPQKQPPTNTPYIKSVFQTLSTTLNWEYGGGNHFRISTPSQLIKPSPKVKSYVLNFEFIDTCFKCYEGAQEEGARKEIREVIIALCSVNGKIFSNDIERTNYAEFLIQRLLSFVRTSTSDSIEDWAVTFLRVCKNFKINLLKQVPHFQEFMTCLTEFTLSTFNSITSLIVNSSGDLDAVEDYQNRTYDLLLECIVIISSESFFLEPATQATLKEEFGRVYLNCVENRIKICKAVEGKCVREEVELDELGERLDEEELAEQINAISTAGRLNLLPSLACLNNELNRSLGNLGGLFESGVGEVGEEAAGILEEVRVLILFMGWLVTDEGGGETPIIPEAIVESCATPQAQQISATITQIVTSLSNLSSYQSTKISSSSASPIYSPLIAQQLMWFFSRFCRVYLMPNASLYDGLEQNILYKDNFGLEANSQGLIDMCTKSAVLYITSWPGEVDVIEKTVKMLEGLCGGRIRAGLARSEGWRCLCNVFWFVGATSIHTNVTPNPQELNAMGLTPAMVEGFRRLNYERRGDVASVLACGSGGMPDENNKTIMNKTLMLVEGVLTKLATVISDPNSNNTHIEAVDLCSLCVSLYSGICRSPFVGIVDSAAEDSAEAYVLTKFITPSLPKLAALMPIYGPVDNSIKTGLLTALTSYAELYISFLNPVESTALYNAASEMIKGYSAIGIGSSAKKSDEEDQHEDVLQAIKLLTHLGTKDFIDVVDNSGGATPTVDVTEVLFYGINHLLPLVSDLLEYPKIAHHFFDLVGYIVEAYPEKLNSLPPDFYESLVGSLLWGMSSIDILVGKSCLRAVEEMTKEHVKNNTLNGILTQKPDTLKLCVQRLLTDVVMAPSVVFDRIDVTGGALLVLIAADLNFFTTYVRDMISKAGIVQEQQQQLLAAFEQLVNLETIQAGIQGKGIMGRNARVAFKKTFELFVKHVHSFLVVV